MKLLNKKQKNNAGFSLVELIVVIAIMVVLVAVLAPLFSKYIESSRRSTDVQNANSIAEGVIADVADGRIKPADSTTHVVARVTDGNPTAVAKAPVTKGNTIATGRAFVYDYNPATNQCAVYVASEESGTDYDNTYNLAEEGTDTTGATGYKNAD